MLQNVRNFLQEHLTGQQMARFALSLLVALVLWGWVTQLQNPVEAQRYAELEIVPPELPGPLEIVTNLPRVTVSITGVSSQLEEISRADITVTVDPSRVDGSGMYQLPVVVELDGEVREMRVSPDTVSVEVEELVSRNFPLTVENQAPDEESGRIVDTDPEVSEVTITGPAPAVDRIDRIVLPVSAQGHARDFVEVIEPFAVDENGQRVQEVIITPGNVRTVVELEARGKAVSVVPQVVGSPAERYVVQQQIAVPSMVIVDGPPEVLDSLLFVNTEPVDISGATDSLSEVVPLENLPEGATLVEPEENRIEVRVSIGPSGGTANRISNMPVAVEDIRDGLDATVDPGAVAIEVQAPSDVLTSLTPDDVSVWIDASGLEPGIYALQPQVEVPDDVEVIQTEPEEVVVVIITNGSATPVAPAGLRGHRALTVNEYMVDS
ncbi:MAG TPA: CdaR family protein [Thermomicrobiales bacterium]|nr:CdaR family protein [Thermomicrobiales bacterium]